MQQKNLSHSKINMRNTKTLMQNLSQAFLKHQNLVDLKNLKFDGGEERGNHKKLETLLETAHNLNKK